MVFGNIKHACFINVEQLGSSIQDKAILLHRDVIFQDFSALKKRQGVGEVRKIKLHKEPDEGLGMSITVSAITSILRTGVVNFT